jgi:hypothetical protein
MATTQQTLTDVEPSLVDKYVTEDGSTIETRESDDGTVEEQCPSCGSWYQLIGSHWAQSSCPYPPISQRKWEMCKGLMMGDGGLSMRNEKNCCLKIVNTNVTFLEYLEDELGWLASVLYQDATAQESANNLNEREINGCVRDIDSKDCVDKYTLNTRCHPLFNEFEQWWIGGEKVFPKLNYTKPLLRMWWVSDGSFNWQTSGNLNVIVSSCNEGKRPENIIQSFSDCGFDCSLHGNKTFSLTVDQTEDFFDYIGHDPVPGFEYKWAWRDHDRYLRLKKARNHVHRTQTIE